MPDTEKLALALRNLQPTSLTQTFFRIIHAKYAATALSAAGSYRCGGRYNPAGAFEVLYLAENPVTALEEVEALLRTNDDLRGVKGPPRIVLSVECTLQHVVQLDEANLRDLDLSLEEVTAPWRESLRRNQIPVTHEIGRISFERGDVEALLVPSAKNPATSNLVVLPDRLIEESALRVFDDSGIIDARLP